MAASRTLSSSEPTFHQTMSRRSRALPAMATSSTSWCRWLEATAVPGRDVEPHAVGRRAIEREIAVDLEKK